MRALFLGNRAHAVAAQQKRILAAKASRDAMCTERNARASTLSARETAVAERHAAKARQVAKVGVLAVRCAAFRARREALDKKRASAFLLKAERCAAVSARRAALLAVRVEAANKAQAAPHPKREMPDEAVDATFSDA